MCTRWIWVSTPLNQACLLIVFGWINRPPSPYPRAYLPALQVLRWDIRSLDPYWIGTPPYFRELCVSWISHFYPYGRSQASRLVLRVTRMVNRHRRRHPASAWPDVPGVEGWQAYLPARIPFILGLHDCLAINIRR
jgi:hypothetical protein